MELKKTSMWQIKASEFDLDRVLLNLEVYEKGHIALLKYLSNEEIEIYETVTKIIDQYENMKTVILEGKSIDSSVSSTKKRERILVRFMTKIPLIVGVDMKNYGSFEPEDIATLPRENAEALIRQKAAIEIRI